MSFQFTPELRDKLYIRGIFPVFGKLDFDMMRSLADFILKNREEKKPVTVLINSSGGSGSSVQQLHSILNVASGNLKLRGVAFGECGSAALALLQCCTTRYGVEGCGFFIHNMQFKPNLDCVEFDRELFDDELDRTKRLQAEMVSFQCRRTGISESEWQKLARLGSLTDGRAIFCSEAKEIGLIDRILPRYPIF